MMSFSAIADVLLYVAFSYLAGSIVLQFIPDDRKPSLSTSKILLLLSTAGVIVLSFMPVYELALFLQSSQGGLSECHYRVPGRARLVDHSAAQHHFGNLHLFGGQPLYSGAVLIFTYFDRGLLQPHFHA